MWLQLLIFTLIWVLGAFAHGVLLENIEPYNVVQVSTTPIPATLTKNPAAFPECTNCVRYFDTVICKCATKPHDPAHVAFLYPTDITPDIDLGTISKGVDTNGDITGTN